METIGQRLQRLLGLSKFKYIYIQRVRNINHPTYIISVDSKYPSTFISPRRLMVSKGTRLFKVLNSQSNETKTPRVILSPPVDLHTYEGVLQFDAVLIVRDLISDYFMRHSMYECVGVKPYISLFPKDTN